MNELLTGVHSSVERDAPERPVRLCKPTTHELDGIGCERDSFVETRKPQHDLAVVSGRISDEHAVLSVYAVVNSICDLGIGNLGNRIP